MNPTVPIETFDFLKHLKNNNNRDWFNENKPKFKDIETEVKLFYNALYNRINIHDDIDKLKLFRIYRDIRFSKNKTPYKTHFGGSFHRKKPALRGGYYLHIAPNNESFIATGFWQPNPKDLLRIRKEFEMDADEIREILHNETFNSVWGNSFIGDEVKTAPKGFDKTHPNIDLIKKKQYIFTKKFTDDEVISSHFIDDVDTAFRTVRPFFNYMSDVLTTNLNGESIL
jgi:uncharacterized protein (TIGR02453 family)